MKIHALVGVGDRIVYFTLPFAALGLAANVKWPGVFRLGFGMTGPVIGFALVATGVPIWLPPPFRSSSYCPGHDGRDGCRLRASDARGTQDLHFGSRDRPANVFHDEELTLARELLKVSGGWEDK
jgi:hypothetical protein